eukprot:5759138-Amphidinium_carterae.1
MSALWVDAVRAEATMAFKQNRLAHLRHSVQEEQAGLQAEFQRERERVVALQGEQWLTEKRQR